MRSVRILFIALLSLALSACSFSGKGGKGSAEEYGMGEGNIPIAEPGSELADINFAFDSAQLDGSAQSMLRTNSGYLLDNPSEKVVIEGHCDERGTSEYNLALGERRARGVYDFMRNLGVKNEQMSTISYGEELPLDPASGESAWARNRRAHFALNK